MSDGARKESGKSSAPDEALGNPGRFNGNDGLEGFGLKEAAQDKTTSDGGSNLESLRQSDIPGAEKVEEVTFDPKCRAEAFAMWERHSKGDV